MYSWRPFASDLVDHTFEDFRKKHDKIPVTVPQQGAQVKEKFDIKKIFPYKLSADDLEKRLGNFLDLQQKVDKQRGDIRKRDKLYKRKLEAQAALHKQEVRNEKMKQNNRMHRIRSMGANQYYLDKSKDLSESTEKNMFILTAADNNLEDLKGKPYTSRSNFPNLTSRNNRSKVLSF